jgi:hypothetical protein
MNLAISINNPGAARANSFRNIWRLYRNVAEELHLIADPPSQLFESSISKE